MVCVDYFQAVKDSSLTFKHTKSKNDTEQCEHDLWIKGSMKMECNRVCPKALNFKHNLIQTIAHPPPDEKPKKN